jgi:hypothetical protein
MLKAGTPITVTLQGLSIGPASKGQSDEIVVTTSAVTDPSDGISSGLIGGQVSVGIFFIAGKGRVLHKTVATITFSFTTSVGGVLVPGSHIKLMFSSGFLALGNSPFAAISGGPSAIATAPTSTSIVIVISNASLASNSIVAVALVGFLLDSSNGASSGGVIASTSADIFPVSYWGGCSCAHSPLVENDFCPVSS